MLTRWVMIKSYEYSVFLIVNIDNPHQVCFDQIIRTFSILIVNIDNTHQVTDYQIIRILSILDSKYWQWQYSPAKAEVCAALGNLTLPTHRQTHWVCSSQSWSWDLLLRRHQRLVRWLHSCRRIWSRQRAGASQGDGASAGTVLGVQDKNWGCARVDTGKLQM